eukprot:CAMPEP_0113281378 /NCGR_PEP_ID=MMETSP0008_2-20120614/28267_1 /TAXON_ID=97485 /ORGANISM="Prymnesium parvum" /LENGTH=57 /DNA_ID=CAMNT_0000131787 /DNA_START=261 /DNA_END=434 /DNA_ORIENTATION=- /assembly_acc=CAM_ASM_000153
MSGPRGASNASSAKLPLPAPMVSVCFRIFGLLLYSSYSEAKKATTLYASQNKGMWIK